MKNFIAMHTFKSAALRDQCFEAMGTMSEQELVAAMTGDKAQCQMSWNDGGNGSMVLACWWKAESEDAIIEQIGEMNAFFDTESHELDNIIDFNSMR